MKILVAVSFFWIAPVTPLLAEGMIPASKPAPQPAAHEPYILIGEKVPDDLTVIDQNGNVRPILSYKSTVEVLVLGFYSSRCPANQAAWWDLRRFFEHYKGWQSVFLGISSNENETLTDLSADMKQAGLGPHYKAVRDEGHKLADKLHILQTPEIVIIDEWGILRYRGPLQSDDKKVPYASKAIDAVIGHTDAVAPAEPPLGQGCPIQ